MCPAAPPVLYPNLAELENYMGLALSSEEIQKNLLPEGSTVGVWAGGSCLPCAGLPHCATASLLRGGSLWGRILPREGMQHPSEG